MAGIDLAGSRDHQPLGAILLAKPPGTVATGEVADALLGAEHGPGQRLLAERGLEQPVVDQIVGRIETFAKLGQDDQLFTLQLVFVELRRSDQVGNQLQPQADIGGQRPGMEQGLVARRPGVQRSADILDRFGDGTRITAASALEHHMLDEVGEAALAFRLGPRADEGVKPDRHGLGAWHRVDGDRQTVGQARQFSHWPLPSSSAAGAPGRRSGRQCRRTGTIEWRS